LRAGTGAVPGLDIRIEYERAFRELDVGDSATALSQDGDGWDWTLSAAYGLTPWIVPYIAVGGDSHASRENALAIFGLRGNYPWGFSWSLNIGSRNRDYPLTLDLKDYRPMHLPLLLRQEVHDLCIGYRRGPLDVTWSGHYTALHYPGLQTGKYALADSGSVWKQDARLAYARKGDYGIARAAGDVEYSAGDHAFRGTSLKDQGLYRFGYEEVEQRSYAARADLSLARPMWEAGIRAGASGLALRALRPQEAFGHHFWDRNGVLDAYQGSLLGLFDRETWLFNGSLYLEQWESGAWYALLRKGWRAQTGLSFQHAVFKTESHLTKRTTTLLVAYEEENIDKAMPTIRADLVTPELRVTKDWGRFYFDVNVAQVLPVRISVERKGGKKSSGSGGGDSGFSGGSRGNAEIGYRLF
jgi:hypothetical protein